MTNEKQLLEAELEKLKSKTDIEMELLKKDRLDLKTKFDELQNLTLTLQEENESLHEKYSLSREKLSTTLETLSDLNIEKEQYSLKVVTLEEQLDSLRRNYSIVTHDFEQYRLTTESKEIGRAHV